MDSELYFPAISDIFNELESNRAIIFPNAGELTDNFFADMAVKTHLDARFLMIIPAQYWEKEPIGRKAREDLKLLPSQEQKKSRRSALSNLHTGKKGNSSATPIRASIAQDLSGDNFAYLQMGREKFEQTFPFEELSHDLSFEDQSPSGLSQVESVLKANMDTINKNFVKKDVARAELKPKARQIYFISKSLLYLMHKKKYKDFFWLLFLCALFQDQITLLKKAFPTTQHEYITEFLSCKMTENDPFRAQQMENLPEDLFWETRKKW